MQSYCPQEDSEKLLNWGGEREVEIKKRKSVDMHVYLLAVFIPPLGSSTRNGSSQYQTNTAFLYAMASALSELIWGATEPVHTFINQPLAHSSWDAELGFTPAVGGSRSAAAELELALWVGLSSQHPWGWYCVPAHAHRCSKLVTWIVGKPVPAQTAPLV